MNFLKTICLLAAGVFVLNSVNAQEWISYQSQQKINDLVDTGDELLLATDAGLVVMNKVTLEKAIFNKANANLTNNHIQTITQSPDGQHWIGTYDMILSRFDGTDFYDLTIPENEGINENTKLYDFKIGPDGDFWLATSDGVFHRQGEYWSQYDEDEFGPDFFEAWDIEINSQGEVFVATNDVYKYVDGEWSNISDTTQLLAYLDADLFFSSSGDLYFAGDLERIGHFDGTQWTTIDNGGLNGSQIIGFTEDVDGNIYFNTLYDGLFKLEGNSWNQQTDPQTEAFDNNTSFFHIDEQNNHWLNYNIYLSVYDDGNILSTSISQHSIEYNNVYKIHKGHNGHMYFLMTTSSNSIAVVDTDGNWSSLQLPANLGLWPLVGDILFLADDNIWIATNAGLYHFDGSTWILEKSEPCSQISIDAEGKIYVLGVSQVYIIDNGLISAYNTNNSPIADLIISGLGVDANDHLWIASFNWEGEAAIQKVATDGTWTTYTNSEYPAINQPAGDFHFDASGNVWIRSRQAGALRFDGSEWTNPVIDNINEIENYSVHSIDSDAAGKLYFSHQYGVTTFQDGVWGNLSIGDVPNNFSSNSSYIKFDDDGTLWWASNRYGVFSYSPEIPNATFSDVETKPDFSIYPNPAENFTTLDFIVKKTSKVDAFIYNQLGQLQSRLDLGQLPAGNIKKSIDLTHLPKGIYTIRLQINEQSFVKTIITI